MPCVASFAPGSSAARRRTAHLSLAGALITAVLAGMVLYRFPPALYGFYPLCPVHQLLDLECPGCGSTRALAALLHGHFAEALGLNALTILLLLPLAASYGMLCYIRAVRCSGDFRWPQLPAPALYVGTGMIVLFTVLRSL